MTVRHPAERVLQRSREPIRQLDDQSPFARDDRPTVFHVTHHKAGSQWVYGVLLAAAPGRIVLPQPEHTQFLSQPLLPGMVYPTVYVSREQFESVELPPRHVTFSVIRDLRDTLISMYFSFRDTHPLMHTPTDHRREFLMARSIPDGLRFLMDTLLFRAQKLQGSWVRSDHALLIRYEELLADPLGGFRRILDHCQIEIPEPALERIVAGLSFETRSGRRLGEVAGGSHLRRGASGGWREHLKGEVLAEFKELYDKALIETGYEKNTRWGRELLKGVVFAPRQGWPVLPRGANACWCGNSRLKSFSPDYDRCPRCGTLVCRRDIIRPAPFGDLVAPVDEGDKWLSSIQASESAGEPMAHVFSRVVDDLWSDEHLAIVETLLQRLPPPGRVLQIGGSTTALCELMEAAGYSTVFLQSNPWFALNAAHQLGIEVRHGHLQDQDFESGSFDAMVILGRTLCRFERPVEFLAAARRLLSDQGLLLVSERFPNLEGSYSEMRARGAEALMWLKPFGNRFAFSKDGLERLINAAGFSTVEMARWKQSYPPWADLLTEWDLVTAADGPTSAVAGTDQAVPETARGRLLAALVEARGEIRTLLERREEDRALAFEQLSRVSWSRVGAGTSGDLVEFGSGWYGPELFGGESFRWGSSPARLSVVATAETAHRLTVRLEPGPGVGGDEMELHLCTLEGEKLASRTVRGRETVSFELPTAARRTTHLQLIAPAGGGRIESDPRILDFRLFDLTLD